MDHKTESALGYPSVRRVVDSIFGVSDTPLTFSDALSGSCALALLAFFCFMALQHLVRQWGRKRGTKRHPYVVRRDAMKRRAVAANDPDPRNASKPAPAPRRRTQMETSKTL